MTKVHRNPPPELPPGSLLGIGIAFAVIGLFSIGQHLLDQWRYHHQIWQFLTSNSPNELCWVAWWMWGANRSTSTGLFSPELDRGLLIGAMKLCGAATPPHTIS
ncbi:MAG: hypothetical protein HC769_35290 [Cyanobacteria bacterium CRU_2_1]|nr:hypothetical protein [Cyanobacteria bacterium CRU_2_1]